MYEDTTEIKSSFDAMANRVDAIYLVYLPTWAILLSNLTIMYLNYDVFCVFCVDIERTGYESYSLKLTHILFSENLREY